MGNSVYIKAQTLAADSGMQFDPRYSHWVAARGKFEGEQWYAPYYYSCTMDGDGDRVFPDAEDFDSCASVFTVDAEESEAFSLECGSIILVREDSQGFVMVTNHKTREEAETKARNWFGE